MITWGENPANNSAHGLAALLSRPDWSASNHAAQLRLAADRLVDDPDATIRMLAAPMLTELFTDPAELRDEMAGRLASEPVPSVRAQLIGVMMHSLAGHPGYIADVLAGLAGRPEWPMLSREPEPATTQQDAQVTVDDFLLQWLIALSISFEQPFATELLETWLTAPADHPARAGRTCVWLRPYLNPDPGLVSDLQTRHAFELLAMPLPQAIAIWDAATTAPTPAQRTAEQAARLQGVIRVSESIGRELHFASGAGTPGRAADPAPAHFTARAFPILEDLTHVPHPAVVQRVIQTLDHIADHDPRRAFLAIAAAATTGHGYQWEPQGADLVVKIIDRYAADHRDLLLTQPDCLTALRRLLETFVRSGWDQAIDQVQSLSEFLY
jgi:hypothetical protein